MLLLHPLLHLHDIFKMNIEGMKKVMEINLWGTIIPTQIFGEAIAGSHVAPANLIGGVECRGRRRQAELACR